MRLNLRLKQLTAINLLGGQAMQRVKKLEQFMLTATKIVKPIIIATASLIAGVHIDKLITGEELRRVTLIEKNGLSGMIIEGDTLWSQRSLMSTTAFQPK
jgi:hypothetical protein